MNFSASLLKALMPRCDADTWAPVLAGAMDEFNIVGEARIAAFLAQVAHESSELTHVEENLNYNALALVKVWPGHFSVDTAPDYAHHPQMIANMVYANRMGNGDEASGDGYAYRGRGPIQLTGRANYAAAGGALDADLESHPEIATTPGIGARIAGWYWHTHGCNELADAGDFVGVTKQINGGTNGLADRQAYQVHALALLRAA